MAADVRDILIRLLGRETVSPEAKKASKAVDDLGDSLDSTAKDAKKLDTSIAEVEQSLKSLASQYARTGDDSFIRQIRAQERELRKLKKTRSLLGEADLPDAKPVVMSLAKQLRGAGQQFSDAISEGLTSAPTPVKVAVAAIVVAGIAGASSAIGAALGGAITAGVGGGAIAAGVSSAMQDPAIQDAASELSVSLKKDLFDPLGESFKAPVLVGIKEIQAEVPIIGELLRRAVSPAAKYIEPLVKGFTGLVRNVIPGLSKAIERAGPIIQVISDKLPEIGTALSDAFDDMSKNGKNAAAGVELILNFAEGAIRVTGRLVGWLTDAYDVTLKFQRVAATVGDTLFGWMPGNIMHDFKAGIDEMIGTTENAGLRTSEWAGKTAQAAAQVAAVSQSTDEYRQRQKLLNGSMAEGIEVAGDLAAAFELLNGRALDSREAESNYQAAIDDLTASIKENGRTLDLHTEKGRANDAAVRNLINATKLKAQATYDETYATQGADAAQRAASQVYEEGRQQLIKNLTQILGNKEAAKKLADQIMQIPKSWSTNFGANTGAATAAVTAFEKKIRGLDGKVITVYARFNAQGNLYIPGQGTQVKNRWGGIQYAMAAGGTIESHFTNSPTVLYGERETGGEAFIPKNGNRQRSLAVLKKAAGWYGASLSSNSPTVMPHAGSMPAVGGGQRGQLELAGEREVVAFVTRLIKQYRLLEVY